MKRLLLALALVPMVRGDDAAAQPAQSVVSASTGQMLADDVPVLAQPLTVKIEGNAVALIARHSVFSAVITGQPSSIMWTVTTVDGRQLDPPTPIDGTGRRQVKFGDVPGVYQLNVAVGGRDGSVAMHHFRHEIIDDRTPVETPDPQAPPTPTPEPAESVVLQAHAEPNNLDSFVRRLVAGVPSPTRIAEARIVGGCFRVVVNSIESGTFTGAGPLHDVQQQAALALGGSAPAWVNFFAGIDGLITALKAGGAPADPASIAPLLSSVSATLAEVQ